MLFHCSIRQGFVLLFGVECQPIRIHNCDGIEPEVVIYSPHGAPVSPICPEKRGLTSGEFYHANYGKCYHYKQQEVPDLLSFTL